MRDFDSIRRSFRLAPEGEREIEREVDDELEAHIALRIEHLVARGMTAEAARAEALRRLGNLPAARGALIDSVRRREGRMRFRAWLDSVSQDATHALRQIRRAPGFSALGIITFALGIGLTTTVFAAVDGVLLRPLPFAEPDRLVALQSVDSMGSVIEVVSSDNWFDWNRDSRTLESSAIHREDRTVVSAGGEGVRTAYSLVSPAFFDVIRPRLVMGRAFTDEDATTRAPVVLISERLWRTVLGGRTGSDLELLVAGARHRVIGIVAGDEGYPFGTDLWMVYRHTQMGGRVRNNINWLAVGRLAPGATMERATEDLSAIARRIRAAEPVALYSAAVHVLPLRDVVLGATPGYLRLLMGAVGFVMLLACVNLAGANLARGASRSREMALRAALGAGRGRIARQLLVEHLVLALIGGAAGVMLALVLTRAASMAAMNEIPRAAAIRIDVPVLLFAFLLSAIAGVLAGLLPARDAARASLRGGLTGGGQGIVRGGRAIPGRILVGFEIAIAVLLMVGAGLLIQSFRTLVARPLGFETQGVVTAEISLIGTRHAPRGALSTTYWSDLIDALQSSPGVESAAIANWIPLGTGGTSFIEIEGNDIPGAGAGYRIISEGYFRTLGVPLLAGRDFSRSDAGDSTRGVIVNRAMAERYWPGQSAIGRRVRAPSMEGRFGQPAPWLTVVGVVGDVRHWGYESDFAPEMYVSYRQLAYAMFTATAVVRGRGSIESLVTTVRERVRTLDPTVPGDIEPLAMRAERLTADRRLTMTFLSVFGGLALVLAAVGVYAVLSFSVAQRTREMAVRSALGADRRQIVRLVLVAGVSVIAVGIAAGAVGAFALTRLMSSLLFEVSPRDPVVLVAAVLVIAVTAVVAAVIPAMRASRVEPMLALKGE